MKGWLESVLSATFLRAVSPGLAAVLMAAPPRKVVRAQLKKIYVLNDAGDMTGEYVLDPECPIDYSDFLRVLPKDGIGDRESLFVGEYVFTAFQSDRFVFVLLSRGQLANEDVDWTALLLTAADSHLAVKASRPPPVRPPEPRAATAATEEALVQREARVVAKEDELAELDARVKADEANLRGRAEEVERQRVRLRALADYVSQVQQSITRSTAKASQSLELAEQLSASTKASAQEDQLKELTAAREKFEQERSALIAAKDELEAKFRLARDQVDRLARELHETRAAFQREKSDWATKDAEAAKLRAAIEARVQELSQRFASMAKERLVMSHKPSGEPPEAAKQAIDLEKIQLSKERKFLQRRAMDILDREEQVRDREMSIAEKEQALRSREEDLLRREEELESQKRTLGIVAPPIAPGVGADEAQKDIEQRVKVIQQRALELLNREEKLKKRAAEIEAMEARLTGKVSTS